ncbi:glucoamylase family protein [Granulicella sibirica]|uniref:glucoamylase family protein n=1 Tax=Granulicella sibirica TaxID=2479048 RepID=UPI001008FEA1|nr:glucoamylase family protein [Granulicella sibirica]
MDEKRRSSSSQLNPSLLNRREALRLVTAAGLTPPLAFASTGGPQAARPPRPPAQPVSAETSIPNLTLAQDAFLDDLEHSACRFFFEQAHPKNGQVRDRGPAAGNEIRRAASTAATGFGLTALCIADVHHYYPTTDIRTRVLNTLQFHLEQMVHERGFLFHFADIVTGKRIWDCEMSSIDTAIFLCGALTCKAYFAGDTGPERQIRELATKLYERVDWPWMLNGGSTFSMGYKPESGFLKARWSTYCELMMLYLLAIGSTTHPIEPTYWQNFARPYINYAGFRYLSDLAPLFTHQYSHAWFDFRNQRDRYVNYFQNSVAATRAHKAFCLAQANQYSDDYWGVTASDSIAGYTAWGGPPMLGRIDGSVVPSAAAGSLPFLPQECLRTLMAMRERYEQNAWGRYGFVDAFHPTSDWYDTDIIGIDQGISLLMAENLRTEFVWKTFMSNPEPQAAMKLAGFHT